MRAFGQFYNTLKLDGMSSVDFSVGLYFFNTTTLSTQFHHNHTNMRARRDFITSSDHGGYCTLSFMS